MVARAMLTAVVLGLSVTLFITAVWRPYRDNQYLRAGEQVLNERDSVWASREWVSNLGDHDWDPYLEGRKEIVTARMYRRLSNQTRAIEAYRRALGARHDPAVLLELGLYEWELGDLEEARTHMARSVRFSQKYLYEIPDISVRREVQDHAFDMSW